MSQTRIHKNKTVLHLLAICCVYFFLVTASGVSAQSIVRLFSTPAERADLERQRLRITRPDLVEEVSEVPVELVELPVSLEEEDEIVDIIYRLGGTMVRDDGRYTVWLNNEAIYEEELPDNIELLAPNSMGQLRITSETTGESFDLKPGQVLNLTTGVLVESYEYSPPPPMTELSEDGAATESPMVETIEPAESTEARTVEAGAIESSASTAIVDGAGVNAAQLVEQARDLQDQL